MLTALLLISSHAFPPSVSRAEDVSSTASVQPAAAAPADSALVERLERLERRQEAPAAAPGPVVTAGGKDGIGFRSADGSTAIRFSGLIQADARVLYGDRSKPVANTVLLRRVRPGVDVTVGDGWRGRITPELGGGPVALLDAWVEWRPADWFGVKAGKFKAYLGYEHAQADAVMPFIERALPSNFFPNREVGLEASGQVFGGEIAYSAGVTGGATDLASADGDADDDKDGVFRIFFLPFRPLGSRWTTDLGVGVGGSYGHRAGAAAIPALPSFRSAGQQTWFAYTGTPTGIGSGAVTRIAPQAAWYAGRVGLIGEYARETQEIVVPKSALTRVTLTHEAWQVTGTVAVCGRARGFKGVPAGAGSSLEVVGRVNEQTIDPDAFAPVGGVAGSAPASTAASARVARGWGAGLNWYPAAAVRLSADFERTRFRGGGGTTAADRENEQLWIVRAQVSW